MATWHSFGGQRCGSPRVKPLLGWRYPEWNWEVETRTETCGPLVFDFWPRPIFVLQELLNWQARNKRALMISFMGSATPQGQCSLATQRSHLFEPSGIMAKSYQAACPGSTGETTYSNRAGGNQFFRSLLGLSQSEPPKRGAPQAGSSCHDFWGAVVYS